MGTSALGAMSLLYLKDALNPKRVWGGLTVLTVWGNRFGVWGILSGRRNTKKGLRFSNHIGIQGFLVSWCKAPAVNGHLVLKAGLLSLQSVVTVL